MTDQFVENRLPVVPVAKEFERCELSGRRLALDEEIALRDERLAEIREANAELLRPVGRMSTEGTDFWRGVDRLLAHPARDRGGP